MNEHQEELRQKVLAAIKTRQIKPIPRWQFLAKDYFFWLVFVVALIIGGLAFSLILFVSLNNDWGLYNHISSNFLTFFVLTMPYLWLVVMVIFIIVADYNLRQTKSNYRYPLILIIVLSIVASSILGVIFYLSGLQDNLELFFRQNLPLYGNFVQQAEKVWDQPERGIISGQIISIDSTSTFGLQDQFGNLWQVLAADARFINREELEIGTKVKITGQKVSEQVFEADEIRYWLIGCLKINHHCLAD